MEGATGEVDIAQLGEGAKDEANLVPERTDHPSAALRRMALSYANAISMRLR
jgi:hypothetical protein